MNATLRRDIMHQVCFAVFITVPMFGSCGPRLISALIETMVMEVFPQHEWVCHKGSIASAMYIVLEGVVSVVIDEKRMIVVKRLNRGEFFGERSLFGAEIRNASIQAKTTVEVVVLLAETCVAPAHPVPQWPRLCNSVDRRSNRVCLQVPSNDRRSTRA